MKSGRRDIDKQNKLKFDRIEGEEEIIENTTTISSRRTFNYNKNKTRFAKYNENKWVLLTSRGISYMGTTTGIRVVPGTRFKYIAQAFNNSACIRTSDDQDQYNVPYDCLIFL